MRNEKRIFFSQLTISGKMNDYLADIDKQASEMFSQLVKLLAARDGITEALKATDQMEWVRRMNAVRETARRSSITIRSTHKRIGAGMFINIPALVIFRLFLLFLSRHDNESAVIGMVIAGG